MIFFPLRSVPSQNQFRSGLIPPALTVMPRLPLDFARGKISYVSRN
jgi:hypothetical protein